MKLSNAHCHPQFLDPKSISSILETWKDNPVIASSTHYGDVHTVLHIAQEYSHVLPTIGWHPWYIPKDITRTDVDSIMIKFKSAIMNNTLPIGEIGLDWHPKWRDTKEWQLEIFERFLQLANEFQRPVVVHCVRAHHEILRLLKKYPRTKLYLHHYQGSSQVSAQYFRYNTYFGLPILQWSKRVNELINSIPKDRLLIETDSCVSYQVVSAQIVKHDISGPLLVRCRSNLFQFIQGTSGNFSQQFQFCM